MTALRSSNSYGQPRLHMVIEPENKFRFRYASESGSHGGILGKKDSSVQVKAKKVYPTVKLENYVLNKSVVIRVSILTDDREAHVLELVGKHVRGGKCYEDLDKDFTAKFTNLIIRNVKKEDACKILMKRKIDSLGSSLTGAAKRNFEKSYGNEVKERAKVILSSATLCFEAFNAEAFDDDKPGVPICEPLYSESILNQKSSLRIHRMSRCSGSWKGGDDVILLCDKVKKDAIKVLFNERDDFDSIIWEGEGTFSPADVHHQVAITFKTPQYREKAERRVFVYLSQNDERSDSVEFFYIDSDDDFEVPLKRKRIRSAQSYNRYQDMLDPLTPSSSSNEAPLDNATLEDFVLLKNENSFDWSGLNTPDSSITMQESPLVNFEVMNNSNSCDSVKIDILELIGINSSDFNSFTEEIPNLSTFDTLFEDTGDCMQTDCVDGHHKPSYIPECVKLKNNVLLPPQSLFIMSNKASNEDSSSKNELKIFREDLGGPVYGDMEIVSNDSWLATKIPKMPCYEEMKETRNESYLGRVAQGEMAVSGDRFSEIKKEIDKLKVNYSWLATKIPKMPCDEEMKETRNESYLGRVAQGEMAVSDDRFSEIKKEIDKLKVQQVCLKLLLKKDNMRNTLLHLAVLHKKNVEPILKMIKFSQVDIFNLKNINQQTALHLAAEQNNAELVKVLCLNGGNPNLKNGKGDNCFHIAAHNNYFSCLRMLHHCAATGVDDFNYEGLTPLHIIAMKKPPQNCEKCLHLLLKIADVNVQDKKAGRTPLHYAVEMNLEFISILLKQPDIDVNIQDFSGDTPLNIACNLDHLNAVQLLLKAGADPHIDSFQVSDPDSSEDESSDCLISEFSEINLEESSENKTICDQTQMNVLTDEKILEPLKAATKQRSVDTREFNSDCCHDDMTLLSQAVEAKICLTLDDLLDIDDWRNIVICLGMDENLLDNILKCSTSRANAVVGNYLKNKYKDEYIDMLKNALEMAGLLDALKIVEEMCRC